MNQVAEPMCDGSRHTFPASGLGVPTWKGRYVEPLDLNLIPPNGIADRFNALGDFLTKDNLLQNTYALPGIDHLEGVGHFNRLLRQGILRRTGSHWLATFHNPLFLAEGYLLLHGSLNDDPTETDRVALHRMSLNVQCFFTKRNYFYRIAGRLWRLVSVTPVGRQVVSRQRLL